ncbi:MAG: DUF2721 domain-containing protein [Sandaracinaceae bacterium]
MVPLWLQPLLLLPGVALLTVSTSARYGQLHAEVHRLVEQGETAPLEQILARAAHFRNALVLLYLSVALLSLCALAVGMVSHWPTVSWWIATVLVGTSVVAVMGAALELVREAVGLLHVLQSHRDHAGHGHAPRGSPNPAD